MKHNRRNYLRFLAELVSASKATVIFLILLFLLVSFSNSYMISEVSKFNKIIDRSREMELEGRYFHQLGFSAFNFDASDYRRLIDQLLDSKSIKDVTFLNYPSTVAANGSEESWDTGFVVYGLSDSHANPVEILEIHDTDNNLISTLEVNHVLLDESAMAEYKKGDQIKFFTYYLPVDSDYHLEEISFDVIVDGFVRRDEIVFEPGRNPANLSNILTTVYDPLDGIAEALEGGAHGYYCFCSVLENNDELINFNEETPLLQIITPVDGVDQSTFFNDVKQCGLRPQELVSYDQALNSYLDRHAAEIRLIKTFGISIIILTVCVVLTVFVSWYTYKRKELGIFVLSGCPWKAAILLSATPYYFSILIGGLLGFSAWSLYEKFCRFELNTIGWKTAVLLMTAYICIYSIGVAVYYFMYKRFSPIDLYKDRE